MKLLTRSDFDGLACGALLLEVGLIDSWQFVHPKDVQSGLLEVTENDVLANIPYAQGCGMWFDHHVSENMRLGEISYKGESRSAKSCARIIYDYYGGAERFPRFTDFIEGVDKVDSGELSEDDILNPKGWVLLGFIMDPRTGLGRFRDFKVSNLDLMANLMHACRTMSIDEILEMPDVHERVLLYHEQDILFRDMVMRHTKTDRNAIITDLRGVETIYTGNRFLVYCLFPEQNISLWIVDGRAKRNCAVAVGHSILNRTSKTHVGSLLLKYGGGGHPQAGTCQIPYGDSDMLIKELVNQIKADG